ncbi:MAG: hypothetical protein JNK76_00855 [Planctomycetales bacterium]|nr:hypothetical protein [Planctomycetales bacterium]MBN8625030.1 hypothetical protein [Planctomycetota bacterium]
MSQAAAYFADVCLPHLRRLGHFDNRELSTIAVLSALHFAASFGSQIFGTVLSVVLGPWAVFVNGLTGEGLPALLLATTVTLIPRIGAAAAAMSTVWLLNGIVTGTISFVSAQQFSVSLFVYEASLLVLLVSTGRFLRGVSRLAVASEVIRTALAIGVANSIGLYIQFEIAINEYKIQFAPYYVDQVALITGFGYGAVGAAIGVIWGRSLRRTAP